MARISIEYTKYRNSGFATALSWLGGASASLIRLGSILLAVFSIITGGLLIAVILFVLAIFLPEVVRIVFKMVCDAIAGVK